MNPNWGGEDASSVLFLLAKRKTIDAAKIINLPQSSKPKPITSLVKLKKLSTFVDSSLFFAIFATKLPITNIEFG